MSKTAVALCAALPLPASAGVPDYIHLAPLGELRTVDGRGPYRLSDPAIVVASFKAGDRRPIDENHSFDRAAPLGGPSPARGWIVGLQARDDGIWGEVEWTAAGRRLVQDKAYRHISPAILHTEGLEVVGIARASLVNNPNLIGLTALHSQQDPSMSFLQTLRAELGLKDDAGEADVAAAIGALKTSVSTHAAVLAAAGVAEGAAPTVALQSVQALAARSSGFAPVLKELGLAESAEPAVALQAVQALKDPTKSVPAAEFVALQSQMSALTDSVAKERAEAFVDRQIAAQKPGVKPMRDHYVTRHMSDPAAVEKELNALPSLHSAGLPAQPARKDGDPVLTADELHAVALMGIDPKEFAKNRDALKTEAL